MLTALRLATPADIPVLDDLMPESVRALLLTACAEAAIAKGFTRLELRSTLPGVPFYAKLGFMEAESVVDMLPDGTAVGFVRMTRAAHFTGDRLS